MFVKHSRDAASGMKYIDPPVSNVHSGYGLSQIFGIVFSSSHKKRRMRSLATLLTPWPGSTAALTLSRWAMPLGSSNCPAFFNSTFKLSISSEKSIGVLSPEEALCGGVSKGAISGSTGPPTEAWSTYQLTSERQERLQKDVFPKMSSDLGMRRINEDILFVFISSGFS